MDFLDPKKKKAYTTRLYVGYVLMAVLIGFGAVVLLYAAFGYGVDKSGQVVQNGLVFLASSPADAEVKVEGVGTDYKDVVVAPERLILNQGDYKFEFLKQGYRTWSRQLEVKGGQIRRLDYPFLFPEELSSASVASYTELPRLFSSSPDRTKLLIGHQDSITAFDLYDLSNQDNSKRTIRVPADALPGASNNSKLALVEWSTDNRHLLVEYLGTEKQKQFSIIDTSDLASSFNLNRLYKKKLSSVRLRDKKPDRFYLNVADQILLSSADTAQTTRILSDVEQFSPYRDDQLLYIERPIKTNPEKVRVRLWRQNDQIYTIKTLPKSANYLLDMDEFNNNIYVVAGASGMDEVSVLVNPLNNLKNQSDASFTTRTLRIDNPSFVSFSANSRFIALQSAGNFVVYDAEIDQQHKFALDKRYKDVEKYRWMDEYRMSVNNKDKFTVFDFDGSNQVELLNGLSPLGPVFDERFEGLLSISSDPNGAFSLNRHQLIIKQ
jgi:hypothetical protein